MAGNRRRKQDNSGVHAFLYVLVVLVLLCGMGYGVRTIFGPNVERC